MTTTDTRIAELLGWEQVPGLVNHYKRSCPKRKVRRGDFTTDLNLTDRERVRKGYGVSVMTHVINGEMVYEVAVFKFEDDEFLFTAEAKTLAGAYALAFLAALEAEKEGE